MVIKYRLSVKLGSKAYTSPDCENQAYGRSSRVSCFPPTAQTAALAQTHLWVPVLTILVSLTPRALSSINCAKKERLIRKVGLWFSVYPGLKEERKKKKVNIRLRNALFTKFTTYHKENIAVHETDMP